MKKKAKKNKFVQMTITVHPDYKRRIARIAKLTNKTDAEVVRNFIKSAFDAVDIIDHQSGDVGGQLQHMEEPTNFHEYSEDKVVCKKKIGFN